jgi:hypothetical protein
VKSLSELLKEMDLLKEGKPFDESFHKAVIELRLQIRKEMERGKVFGHFV